MAEVSITRASLPDGYSLVPKGNVFITGSCRRHTQAASRTVYVVFKNQDMKEKLGIGVPTEFYLQVQLDERNTRAERASNVLKRDQNIAKEFEKAILEEFPRIPASEVPGVLGKALEKGRGKVGRTSTLDITKKVILAVRAYIRHQHTDYDMLLRRGMDRDEARNEVAAMVHETDKAWGRIGGRLSRQKAKKQQLPQPTVAKRTATSSKPSPPLAKRSQTTTSKPRSTDRQLIDGSARSPLSQEPDMTDQSNCDAVSVDSTMQKLDELRRRKILNVITNIQGLERKLGNSKAKRGIKRKNSILKLSKIVNKLLEDVGLQRVDTPMAREHLAKQLRLIVLNPAANVQVATSGMTSGHQAKTRRPSPRAKLSAKRGQYIGLADTGSGDNRREPLNEARVVIDLTGDSDDDLHVVSVNTNTTTRHKRNEEAARAHELTGRRSSDATARELQRELRDLGVGNTGQALPRKRQAAVKADSVLSKRFHSREPR